MNYDLYVVTDDTLSNGLSHVEVARRSYEGGADIVQLRVKDNDPRFLSWAKEISAISRSYGRCFIVNDDVEQAAAKMEAILLAEKCRSWRDPVSEA